MYKLLALLTLGGSFLFSCESKKKTSAGEEPAAPASTAVAVTDPGADSAAIRKLVVDFYSWYDTGYHSLEDYNLYSSGKKNGGPPYKINWEEVTRYQQYIRSHIPQLGETFLANQQRFFQQCDSAFKVDTEDELPYGFDYDWYSNSQDEPGYLVDQVKGPARWVIKISGEEAVVDIRGTYDAATLPEQTLIKLGMKKENGSWKIAKIGLE